MCTLGYQVQPGEDLIGGAGCVVIEVRRAVALHPVANDDEIIASRRDVHTIDTVATEATSRADSVVRDSPIAYICREDNAAFSIAADQAAGHFEIATVVKLNTICCIPDNMAALDVNPLMVVPVVESQRKPVIPEDPNHELQESAPGPHRYPKEL